MPLLRTVAREQEKGETPHLYYPLHRNAVNSHENSDTRKVTSHLGFRFVHSVKFLSREGSCEERKFDSADRIDCL